MCYFTVHFSSKVITQTDFLDVIYILQRFANLVKVAGTDFQHLKFRATVIFLTFKEALSLLIQDFKFAKGCALTC